MKTISELIKEELEHQGKSISWFAQKLSCDRSNVYRIFQKNSIDTKILTRISIILHRNFFKELAEEINQKEKSQYSQ